MGFYSTIRLRQLAARAKGKAKDGFRKFCASHRQWELMKSHLNRLIIYQRLEMSLIWARELQQYAEELVHLAKKNTPYADGIVESMLKSPEAREILYERIVPRYEFRDGLVTRVVNQYRFRQRDTTPMAFIEFIDRPGELFPAKPTDAEMKEELEREAATSRRARRLLNSM